MAEPEWRSIPQTPWREGLQNRVPPQGSMHLVPPQYLDDITTEANWAGIPPEALANLIQTESQWDRNTRTGSASERGIGQFRPETARMLGLNPMNDRQAIEGAAQYLYQTGQNMDTAPAGYNWGPNRQILQGQRNVDWNALPEETRNYNWQLRQGVPADHPFVDPEPFGTGSMPGLRGQLDATQPGWRDDLTQGTLGSLNPAPFGDADALMSGEAPTRTPRTSWDAALRNPVTNDVPYYGGADFVNPGGILNLGDGQGQPQGGVSPLESIATRTLDATRQPGPNTSNEFFPTERFGPLSGVGTGGDERGTDYPWRAPTEQGRAAGAFDLRPTFEDLWAGDQSMPAAMEPGSLDIFNRYRPTDTGSGQNPPLQLPDDDPQSPYQGPPSDPSDPFMQRNIGGLPTDEMSAAPRTRYFDSDPYNQQPPPDFGEAAGGVEQRTPFELGGGIGGWLGREGNRIYDASADVAGQVVGGMGDLADWTRGLSPSLGWGGAEARETPNEAVRGRFPQGDETFTTGFPSGRFDAATPGWRPQDNTVQQPDVWPPMQGTPEDIVPGTTGDRISRRFLTDGNITGGIDPGTEADYTHGQTLNRGFINGQNSDVWPDMNEPQGQYLPSWRPSGGFPQQGLDPVASTPTYDEEQWMPSWRSGGGFPDSTVGGGSNLSRLSLPEQVSGFPSGGMADFRSFTPGGGFRDDDSSSTGSLSFDDRWSGVNMRTGQDAGPSGTLQDWRFNLPTSYDQGAQDETFDTGPSGTAPEWRNRIAATMLGGGSMQYDQGAQDEVFDTGPSGTPQAWRNFPTHYDQGAQNEAFDTGPSGPIIYANQPGGFSSASHLSLPSYNYSGGSDIGGGSFNPYGGGSNIGGGSFNPYSGGSDIVGGDGSGFDYTLADQNYNPGAGWGDTGEPATGGEGPFATGNSIPTPPGGYGSTVPTQTTLQYQANQAALNAAMHAPPAGYQFTSPGGGLVPTGPGNTTYMPGLVPGASTNISFTPGVGATYTW